MGSEKMNVFFNIGALAGKINALKEKCSVEAIQECVNYSICKYITK